MYEKIWVGYCHQLYIYIYIGLRYPNAPVHPPESHSYGQKHWALLSCACILQSSMCILQFRRFRNLIGNKNKTFAAFSLPRVFQELLEKHSHHDLIFLYFFLIQFEMMLLDHQNDMLFVRSKTCVLLQISCYTMTMSVICGLFPCAVNCAKSEITKLCTIILLWQ